MNTNTKAFGLSSAVSLGIGSMVGVGILIVIGQAGAIAGNLVWISFGKTCTYLPLKGWDY